MKRDWDLIRVVLGRLEAMPDADARLFAGQFPEWPEAVVDYHLWLLLQSGLIAGKCNRDMPGPGFACYGVAMTWSGQEFFAAVRAESAWNRIKGRLADKAVDLSFEAIVAAARAAIS